MNVAAVAGGQMRSANQKWRILAACASILCINAAFPIYGASVVNTAMVTAMKLDRSMLGLLVTANMLITGTTAPLMGAAVSRFGSQRTLIGGCAAMIIGSLVMAYLVHGPLQAVAAFGLFIGLAMSAGGFIANQACVAGWFVDNQARPFAILYATMGAGGFVAAPLISEVVARSHDWSAGWLVFTVMGAIALALAVLVVRDPPSTGAPVEFGPPGGGTGDGSLKSPQIWLVIFCMMVAGAGSALYIAHGLAMLQDYGHAPIDAAWSMSLMAASTLIGNFLIGAFGQRAGLRRSLAGGSIIYGIGLLLLANAHNTAMFYAYPVVLGAGFGVVQVGAMALLSKCTAANRFAAISGVAISLQTVASAATPFIGGWLYDHSHTYIPLTGTMIALNMAAAGLLLLAKRLFPQGA